MSVGSFLFNRAADAVVPGSGEVLGVLERLKPLIPYVLGIIAALILGFVIYRAPWAESRQKAADYAHFQPVLDRAAAREKVAIKSLASASAAMHAQSNSIRLLAAAEAAKLAVAQQALTAAHKLVAARNAVIDQLHASAAKPLPGLPCEPSDATKDAWQ
jgi:hypothetical protein